jgi:hypothetical protein
LGNGRFESISLQRANIARARELIDFRQAQLELRNMGLYNGSLDGVVGPETKRALEQFQKNNGLDRTARLDGQTMVALFGNIGISQGSSMPPRLIKAPGL